MANYGPPGGPYPGPPPDPSPDPDERTIHEYGQPADPWGDQDQLGGQPGPSSPSRHQESGPVPAAHPGGATPFGPPPAGWVPAGHDSAWSPPDGDQPWPAAPDPAPRRGGIRVVVGVLVALAFLVAGGVGIGLYLFGHDRSRLDAGPTAGPTSGPPPGRSGPPQQSTQSAPAPARSTDVRFVKAGQCVRNEGTEDDPVMTVGDCAPQTYEVLVRYNGATTGDADAKAKCAKVENYTNYFFFNSELDDLDFVLCLRKR